MLTSFDFQPRTRVVFGVGCFTELGELTRSLGISRPLLVADRGMLECGYVNAAINCLQQAGITAIPFHDFAENPDTAMVEAGRVIAAAHNVDGIIAPGGGSSLDCAKGINFVLTNGGTMKDYQGYAKTTQPLLPMIGVPTTAGTGSEAQSYALISDAETHVKMACGDPRAAFRIALLDPRLTVTQPTYITATTGYDALAHAVETFVTTKRNPLSEMYAREAWRLLAGNYERVLETPDDLTARAEMQLGAYFAGVAIENSMLGATHACANPLTARYGTTHGEAIALMLPHVVRWNSPIVNDRYAELVKLAGIPSAHHDPGENLARRLEQLADAGGLVRSLRQVGIAKAALPLLAEEAARQWTGTFNPRQWHAAAALEVYECAY